ncbi:hypothetical protein HU200_017306 [Digitaria exilis]|uniref:Zinc finger GRF-type domain-containing protein n=1 Tax=Digitaria exilis TaxID=1010633 RepID=A0A835F6K3_9POAL|nr:hypothetical protein HU200_017306 [Digitaria exilis]
MSTWRDDRNVIPPWNERPKCHCGFRTWLQVWDEPLPRGKKGCRFFKCPDIDDDFKACTFMQWVDTRPLGEVRAIPEHKRRVRQQQIRLKDKEDELKRQRAHLGEREAALKIQEEQFQAHEADLKREEEKQKHRYKEAGQYSTTDGRKGKVKFLRFTQ